MGVVWEAWHTTLGISVAVKVLREPVDEAESIRHRERFRQEAHIAARVNHPNLVRVLDFGEEGTRPYLVMELVRGPTLEAWLHQQGLIDERTAIKVAGHICVGLAGLHQFGVVHRDIKPSNVLIEAGQRLKISDLGLARDPSSSHPGEVAGTPQYLAPECLSGDKPFDLRSDLYAVGIILYRLLFGRLPFDGTTERILHAHLWEQPDWSLPVGIQVDSGTLYMLRRLLEKDPSRRIQTALEAIQACRDQVQRLDMHERVRRLREERPTPQPVARARYRAAHRQALNSGWWTGIVNGTHTAIAGWVPWALLGTLLLAGAVAAGRGLIRP